MKLNGNRLIIGVCLASLVLPALCDTAAAKPPVRGPMIRSGPPAHAPAHGYRRQHLCGFELVFDVGLGVYVAVGATDVYYHTGYFYRCRGGVWEISLKCVTWEVAGIEKLPPGLQVKAKSMLKVNGNGNSLVKLNGNGNSLVKLNGNAGDNAGKSNGPADAGANKPAGSPADNAGKSAVNANGATDKPNTVADAMKAGGPATANTGKPAGSAANNLNKPGTSTGAVANKPAAKTTTTAKPAGNGKKR